MKLWLLTQTTNTGYDTYDSAVVAADTDADARAIHPTGESNSGEKRYDWAPSELVTAECLGEAAAGVKRGVYCASFHAG